MAIYLGNNIIGVNPVFSTGSGGGSSTNIVNLNVNANGMYTAPSGTAYSPVNVNVETILTPGIIRPDAEKVYTWSYDYMANEDLEITIPAYSTTAATLRASANLTPTATLDYTNYNWIILEKAITIPKYSISTLGKGRVEYHIGVALYEIAELTAGEFVSLANPSHKIDASRAVHVYGPVYRSIYYSSATALTAYSTSAYSTVQAFTAPAISSTTLTIKTPSWTVRGSTSYFVNTYFNAIEDIRYQFAAELYRVPKDELNLNGCSLTTSLQTLSECMSTNDHTLTPQEETHE